MDTIVFSGLFWNFTYLSLEEEGDDLRSFSIELLLGDEPAALHGHSAIAAYFL